MGNLNDKGERVPLGESDYHVAVAKQLKAVRLLRFLLPERNQVLLRKFLDLLTVTLLHSQINRMSAESLGTLFGPVMLAPTGVSFVPYSDHHFIFNLLIMVLFLVDSRFRTPPSVCQFGSTYHDDD